MQIFEITQKSVTNEVNVGAVSAALANRARTAVLQKANVTDPGDNSTPYGDTRGRAAQQVELAIQEQAKTRVNAWQQAIAQLCQREGRDNVSQLSANSKTILKRSLVQQLHENMMRSLIRDYTTLPSVVSSDPGIQAEAVDVVQNLTQAITAIENNLNDASSTWIDDAKSEEKRQYNNWLMLCRGAYQAMALLQFEGGRDIAVKAPTLRQVSGSWQLDRLMLNAADPAHKLLIDLSNNLVASGVAPNISITPTGDYYVGTSLLDPANPAAQAIINLIKANLP
jgi:hypothetical protein